MSVWQWIVSLFTKKAKTKTVSEDEIILSDPYAPLEVETHTPENKSFTLNEMPEYEQIKQFKNKAKVVVEVAGIKHNLTEKQYIFYNAVCRHQLLNNAPVPGWKIAYEFVKEKHGLEDSELTKLPKWKFSLSSHNKTMKYLLANEIIYRVNGKFKARV